MAIGISKPSDDSWFLRNYEQRPGDKGVENEICNILKSAGGTEWIPFWQATLLRALCVLGGQFFSESQKLFHVERSGGRLRETTIFRETVIKNRALKSR